jgi:hypothetical protein
VRFLVGNADNAAMREPLVTAQQTLLIFHVKTPFRSAS